MWWARLVVPARLRARAGRREFVQSTGTHEFAVGKVVASVLLTGWRRQLFEWERGRLDSEKLLRLVEGSPELGEACHITIQRAGQALGLDRATLLRAVASGRLTLHCQLGASDAGHVIPLEELEPVDALQGRRAGVIVPHSLSNHGNAEAANFPHQVLRVPDGQDVASAALAESLEAVSLLLLDAPSPAGWVFIPDRALRVSVDDLLLVASEVEAMRIAMLARVAPERIDHARAERSVELETRAQRERSALEPNSATSSGATGKWASKRFSEAVDAYCQSADGLPSTLRSTIDQRQRKAGLMVFAEFMGDCKLSEIDGDLLRAFRDGPLKTIPGRINTLPKSIKRDTMRETIAALGEDGREWPLLSDDMRAERMHWLARFFTWVHKKGYLSTDPALTLRGETGLTKAEQIKRKRAADDDDEEGREPFDQAQLNRIYSQLHYKTGHGRHVKKPARWYAFEYWLPLMGLYAGLRLKEASQLHLTDVKRVDDVWCFDINESTEDKSVKGDQSWRVIPVHPELIRLGFISYCERLRSLGYRRVFPELTWSRSNAKYAKESGRKMSAMLESLGMPRNGLLVFHCLRHNMNNALARVPVSEAPGADENIKRLVQYALMGHTPGQHVNVRHYTTITTAEKAALLSAATYALPDITPLDIDFAVAQAAQALQTKRPDRRGREDMGPLNDSIYANDGVPEKPARRRSAL
jgi:hypothetical protein